MKKWFIKNKPMDSTINLNQFSLNPFIYKILANRGIMTLEQIEEYLNPVKDSLHSPILLKDMVKASNLLNKAKQLNKHIRIVGDYDVDGVMSTSILYLGLSQLGFRVDYVVPHRVKSGYGLHIEHVKKALEDKVDVILTCDNGISAFDAIDYAKKMGLTVIVTDHHQVVKNESGEDVLPSADAVINPHRSDCTYPFSNLCGGAVAYKLIEYLFTINGTIEEFDDIFLIYAGIATVCDIMPLIGENRTLTSLALDRINFTEHIGLLTLMQKSNVKYPIGTFDLGFILGPIINSAGRLDDATIAVELFTTEDASRVSEIVEYLRDLNSKRQMLTKVALEKYEEQIRENQEADQLFIILFEKDIHESLAGIIAGRIKEKYNRPTLILTNGKDGMKGSGRSVEAVNIMKELEKSDFYFTSFGGHPMACGVSLKENDFDSFKENVLSNIDYRYEDLIPSIRIDAALSLGETNLFLAKEIERLAPFGRDNEEPVFGAKNLLIRSFELLGMRRNVLSLWMEENGERYKVIAFQPFDELISLLEENVHKNNYIDILYIIRVNRYNNRETMDFILKDFRFHK